MSRLEELEKMNLVVNNTLVAEYIDLLKSRINELMETIEDISKDRDCHDDKCDCDNCCEDNEFKIGMNKEDLD